MLNKRVHTCSRGESVSRKSIWRRKIRIISRRNRETYNLGTQVRGFECFLAPYKHLIPESSSSSLATGCHSSQLCCTFGKWKNRISISFFFQNQEFLWQIPKSNRMKLLSLCSAFLHYQILDLGRKPGHYPFAVIPGLESRASLWSNGTTFQTPAINRHSSQSTSFPEKEKIVTDYHPLFSQLLAS